MLLKKVTFSGSRCFGENPTDIHLPGNLTTFVGANASGKTALLQGLAKLFGVSRSQRTLHRSDFHIPPEVSPEDRSPRKLFIDVLIEFPELYNGTATPETVAPVFRHMFIEQSGDVPVCRIRMEAQWNDDGTAEGEVSQDLYWVDTRESIPPEKKTPCFAVRSRTYSVILIRPLTVIPALRFVQPPVRWPRGFCVALSGPKLPEEP